MGMFNIKIHFIDYLKTENNDRCEEILKYLNIFDIVGIQYFVYFNKIYYHVEFCFHCGRGDLFVYLNGEIQIYNVERNCFDQVIFLDDFSQWVDDVFLLKGECHCG